MCRCRRVVVIVALLCGALALAGGLRRKYVVPILMYHSVTPDCDPENRLCVSTRTFERQMKFLKERRYQVVPLKIVAEAVRKKKQLPARTVALTFDDGYQNNYHYAFPILKKYQLPATLFIIVNEVGRSQNDRLNWQQLQEMQSSGLITIGSHCLGADPLTKISSVEERARQIGESKRILAQRMGEGITLFSYPEGRFTPEIRGMVIAAGYQAAVVTNPGRRFPNDDPFLLKRLRISETSRHLFVFWVEASGYYNLIREWRKK